jgi:excinuclease ABC subunit B
VSGRRTKQQAHNQKHGITPESIRKAIPDIVGALYQRESRDLPRAAEEPDLYVATEEINKTIKKLEKAMKEAASKMDFEKAAEYRDRMLALERRQIEEGL